jgi:hypothetical protein
VIRLGQMLITVQSGSMSTWRISDKEPADLRQVPVAPEDTKWKFSG